MATEQTLSAPAKPLLAAVKRLLRPLVRLLVSRGVGLAAMTELLKEVYVGVAMQEFPADKKSPSDSRISVMTGVHRKDVKRLRTLSAEDLAAPRTVSLGAQIVSRWLGSSETTDANGRPLPLPRQSASGPSFDALVESVSTDVRPRAVLDDWLRLGVARLEGDRVVLNQAAFVAPKGFEEKSFYLGRNVGDHIAAAAHNLLGDGNALLERSVHYSNLTESSVKSLTEAAERTGMQALLALNRMALDLSARDKGDPNAVQRINFGLYFYNGTSSFKDLGQSESVGTPSTDA
ncbi:MAG: hypothetical protein EPO08_19080 [Rhodospirillaceae bacterium]|nr:MAG: hypothetical protein EPO08_19080 [Rhodospirillaceae bacterium]